MVEEVSDFVFSLFNTPNNEDNPNQFMTTMENEYTGKGYPLKLLEVKALKIDMEHRAGEARLMRGCWYDYRDMHPAAKTYLYAELYRQQTVKFYETVVDIRTVEDVRAFTPDDIFSSRDMTSMWLARRMCDEHGWPYDFAIRFANDRFFNRAQPTFPRPNQLYGEELEADMHQAWRERIKRQITYAQSSRFRMSNWKGEVVQAQHLQFVISQVKQRPTPRYRLLARLLSEDVLSLPMISTHFSQQDAIDAERYCREYM